MTRGDFFYKWFWYAVATVPVWLLEDVIFGQVTLFGLTPVLLPLAAVAVAVLEGASGGAGFGMAMGMLCYATWAGARPIIIPGLILGGILIGSAARYGLKQTGASYLLCSGLLLLVLDVVRILLWQLNQSAPLFPMLKTTLLEILISLLFAPVIWLLYHKVFDRVGGTRLM